MLWGNLLQVSNEASWRQMSVKKMVVVIVAYSFGHQKKSTYKIVFCPYINLIILIHNKWDVKVDKSCLQYPVWGREVQCISLLWDVDDVVTPLPKTQWKKSEM